MKRTATLFHGFMMALADSVPGVSGGTIAFLMGFYDKFINSLNNLISGTMQERKAALLYLINLGIGWVIGFAIAVTLLASLFTKEIYMVSSLFMGFIVFAIPIIINEEKETLKKDPRMLVFAAAGIALVVLITWLNSSGTSGIDISQPGIGDLIYIFFAGAVAISAMVLPGISGSTLMLIFGIYLPIITAVKNLLHLDFSGLNIIIPFGLGIIAGIIAVIKLVKNALQKHRTAAIYAILGLMTGSLYAIVMGPATLDEPKDPLSLGSFNVIAFIIGGAVIAGMQLMKITAERRRKGQEA